MTTKEKVDWEIEVKEVEQPRKIPQTAPEIKPEKQPVKIGERGWRVLTLEACRVLATPKPASPRKEKSHDFYTS